MYENGKMRPVETLPGMGAGVIKENGEEGELKYDTFDIRTLVNATMYPQHKNKTFLKRRNSLEICPDISLIE
jgi:hypothetical protein